MRVIRRCVLGIALTYTAGVAAALLQGLSWEFAWLIGLNAGVAWVLYGVAVLVEDTPCE